MSSAISGNLAALPGRATEAERTRYIGLGWPSNWVMIVVEARYTNRDGGAA
ncbi:MAG TPA: hypothetical protein VK714_07040 [Myxococcota bacterium]|nr:hypothetical protein [Myxococcota bacterium]